MTTASLAAAFSHYIPVKTTSLTTLTQLPLTRPRLPDHRPCLPATPTRRCQPFLPSPVASSAPSSTVDVGKVVENSSLRKGIQYISVGKFGEKPIPPSLIPAIAEELRHLEATPYEQIPKESLYLRASFLGSLFMKRSLTTEEYDLLRDATMLPRTSDATRGAMREEVSAGHVVATVIAGADIHDDKQLREFALRLLCGEELSAQEAEVLGRLLYADDGMSEVKACIAHVMRVRHETAAEICGLCRAVNSTGLKVNLFQDGGPERLGLNAWQPVALVAEPFDGVVTWDLLTPLVCRHLHQNHGYQALVPCSASSGPKYGPNVRSLYAALAGRESLSDSELGAVIDQEEFHPGTAKWVHMRQIILKRPALATAEKYMNPLDGELPDLFVSSAFHGAYIEKMADAAEHVGFNKYIIVSKGMEGSLGLGVPGKPAIALIGWKRAVGGAYARQEVKLTYSDKVEGRFAGIQAADIKGEEKNSATIERNVERVEQYIGSGGKSGNDLFDCRVEATCQLLDQALYLIQSMQLL